ncbi:septum site-determining protein MinC [Bacillus carboniphilus]|uniref:Probable septum site-determining protein MinC n=1 Tax=Bacillus carboniphilus TaxID=86663 RepID=A0ABY9JZ73_9BACI|nr:septum site-determining protein MinC [Bacillus carboniphilus]WLR44084.1 septum site-determining protein MinC [Bacillus carboniphilus]
MKVQKQQNVTIKGTRDGLTLHINDRCSLDEVLIELEHVLNQKQYDKENGPLITVNVNVGNRYLTNADEEKIKTIIRKKPNLTVQYINSDIMTKEEAERWKEESEVTTVVKIVRSGQVLHVEGDLLLVGDVNPGGKVIANGNIFIVGALKGSAHAGFKGDGQAVIVASVMNPMQLKISNIINRAPDQNEDSSRIHMECAYINDEEKIVIERLQQLSHIRPNLSRFEGGINGG